MSNVSVGTGIESVSVPSPRAVLTPHPTRLSSSGTGSGKVLVPGQGSSGSGGSLEQVKVRSPYELTRKPASFAPGNGSPKVLKYFKTGMVAFLMKRRWHGVLLSFYAFSSVQQMEASALRGLPHLPKRTGLLQYQTWMFMAMLIDAFLSPNPNFQTFKKAIKTGMFLSSVSSSRRQPGAAARGFIASNVNLSG